MISILIAEDNPLLRASYQELLTRSFGDNIDVHIVSNGYEALQKVKKGHRYDLILLDLDTPVMGGIQAAQKMKALGLHQPILAHSSLGIRELQPFLIKGIIDGFALKIGGAQHLIQLIKTYANG